MTKGTTKALNDVSVAVYELPSGDDDAPLAPLDSEYDIQRDRSLLLQNASWFCRLRWIVVGVLVVAGIAAFIPSWTARFGVQLSVNWPLAAAAMLTVANGLYLFTLNRLRPDTAAGHLRILLWSQIVLDLAVLTVVVHFLGSRVTYAPVAYLFHIILACIFFHRWESLGVTIVSAAMYGGLVLLENYEFLGQPSALSGAAAGVQAVSLSSAWIYQLGFLLGIWMIIWYLASRLAAELRDRERELAATNRRLEASSLERACHMLQTTHQLKAPFAAIHANTQLLLGGYSGTLSDEARSIIEKITLRSRTLSQQIQEMLQLANLRSQSQARPSFTMIDLPGIIQETVDRFAPVAASRNITIDTDLESVHVRAIDDYLKMLIDNLINNAVSYSFDGGRVRVVCQRNNQTTASMVVRDHGIGIPADKLSHVFQDYYRTTEAAHHNKASTGLGLAIVRLVARALQASVRIESSPGWGTRVTLQMPAIPGDFALRTANQGE
jgi:signal transduction histidine kinase